MLESLSKSVGLRVFALLLLVVSTPEGRQINGREKAVEAEVGIKTFTWDDVEDYYPEIHREHDNEKYEEDSSNKARENASCTLCSTVNQKMISVTNHTIREKICHSHKDCMCRIKWKEESYERLCDKCVRAGEN